MSTYTRLGLASKVCCVQAATQRTTAIMVTLALVMLATLMQVNIST